MNSKEQAERIYQICVATNEPLTYGQVLEDLGYRSDVAGHALRYGLELVRIACARKDLPVLTAIVVNKSSGRPAPGALPENVDWDAETKSIFARREWPSVEQMEWDYVWQNRRQLSADFGLPDYWAAKSARP